MCLRDPATTEIYTLSLHDALPISGIGLPTRRSRGSPFGRIPNVLRYGEPGRLVRFVDDGYLGKSHCDPGSQGVRLRSRIWKMAHRCLCSGTDGDHCFALVSFSIIPSGSWRDP